MLQNIPLTNPQLSRVGQPMPSEFYSSQHKNYYQQQPQPNSHKISPAFCHHTTPHPLDLPKFYSQTASVFLPKEQPGLMQIDLLIAHLWAHIFMDTINFALIGFYVASLIDDRKYGFCRFTILFCFLVQLKFNIKETSSLLFLPNFARLPLGGGRLLSFT